MRVRSVIQSAQAREKTLSGAKTRWRPSVAPSSSEKRPSRTATERCHERYCVSFREPLRATVVAYGDARGVSIATASSSSSASREAVGVRSLSPSSKSERYTDAPPLLPPSSAPKDRLDASGGTSASPPRVSPRNDSSMRARVRRARRSPPARV